MSVVWDIFWCKVFFKEYIKHYRKMTDEQIVKDVRQSMDDLEDLVDSSDSFGSQMVRWSVERAEQPFATAARENGKKGGRPRKNQDTTADGDTREDSLNIATSGNGSVTESGTSANHYGVAAISDGAESFVGRESGCSATTTDSKNMRRVPQNEAPAHGFSGGRTAQGTMSRSPEAAAQSGKDYNQETDQVSTDEARQSQGRTGAPVRGATSSTVPVRSYRPRKVPHPKGEYEVFDFAGENGIPEWVANEFYQRFFVERDGVDTDGNRIDNWKGALINYNKSRKRETA